MKVSPHKSSLGPDANIVALLAYAAAFILSWIPFVRYVAPLAPLFIFYLERESTFVRFHAMQALVLEAVSWICSALLGIVILLVKAVYYASVFSLTGRAAGLGAAMFLSGMRTVFGVVLTAFAVFALIKAFRYDEYKLPILGDFAAKLAGRYHL